MARPKNRKHRKGPAGCGAHADTRTRTPGYGGNGMREGAARELAEADLLRGISKFFGNVQSATRQVA